MVGLVALDLLVSIQDDIIYEDLGSIFTRFNTPSASIPADWSSQD